MGKESQLLEAAAAGNNSKVEVSGWHIYIEARRASLTRDLRCEIINLTAVGFPYLVLVVRNSVHVHACSGLS